MLGPVASPPTGWRILDEVTPGRRKAVATSWARIRHRVWASLTDGVPASRAAGTDLDDVLELDATFVIACTEKEQAALT